MEDNCNQLPNYITNELFLQINIATRKKYPFSKYNAFRLIRKCNASKREMPKKCITFVNTDDRLGDLELFCKVYISSNCF